MIFKCPIFILHGSKDRLIPIHHSEKLKKLQSSIDLTILEGFGHNDITLSEKYLLKTTEILTLD